MVHLSFRIITIVLFHVHYNYYKLVVNIILLKIGHRASTETNICTCIQSYNVKDNHSYIQPLDKSAMAVHVHMYI